MKIAIAALAGLAVLGAANAYAHPPRLNPAQCPDLREDRRDAKESRRDERIDWSRRDVREDRLDRKESRRDRAVVVCPRAAYR
jgi:hypothetical protein